MGSPGASRGDPESSWDAFWAPGATLTIGMLALGGLGGGLGRSKNRPRLIFERSKGVKVLRSPVSSMFTLWI